MCLLVLFEVAVHFLCIRGVLQPEEQVRQNENDQHAPGNRKDNLDTARIDRRALEGDKQYRSLDEQECQHLSQEHLLLRKLMPGPGHKARKNAQRREFDRRQERLVAKSRVRVEHQPQNGDDDRNQRRKHEKQDQFIDKKTLEFHRFTLPSMPL